MWKSDRLGSNVAATITTMEATEKKKVRTKRKTVAEEMAQPAQPKKRKRKNTPDNEHEPLLFPSETNMPTISHKLEALADRPRKDELVVDPSENMSEINHLQFNYKKFIQQQYAEFKKKTEETILKLTKQKIEYERKVEEIKNSTGRAHMRNKILWPKRINELSKQLEPLLNGQAMAQFTKKLDPFAQAFKREYDIEQMMKLKWMTRSLQSKMNHSTQEHIQTHILEEYNQFVHKQPVEPRIQHREFCSECGKEMIIDAKQSYLICSCGTLKENLDSTSAQLTFVEGMEYTAQGGYMPLNHLTERLNLIQAKEKKQVPDIYKYKVALHIMQHDSNVQSSKQIFLQDISNAMRQLQASRIANNDPLYYAEYYKHYYQIWYDVTGRKQLRILSDHEEKIKGLFQLIYALWNKNMGQKFCYTLTLKCCLIKLGYTQYCPYVVLSKNEKKVGDHINCFNDTCKHTVVQNFLLSLEND